MTATSSKTKVIITGSNGQLGRALRAVHSSFPELLCDFLCKDDLDITDPLQVERCLELYKPDILINTAAYTNVDAAENNRELAILVNGKAIGQLASAAQKYNVGFIHISTDYVFDGLSRKPYVEDQEPNPKTVYGKSKLLGEQMILNSGIDNFAIIRTSWLYSAYGNNFVKTMLRLVEKHKEISVVDDQLGSPTWANDLAKAIMIIASQLDTGNSGIYHYSNTGKVSWYAFAKAIFTIREKEVRVIPIPSDQYPTTAIRPKNSVLDSSKIAKVFQVPLFSWKESLRNMLGTY